MPIVRFSAGEDPAYGVLEDNGRVVAEIVGDPIYQGVQFTGRRLPIDDVRLLAPFDPVVWDRRRDRAQLRRPRQRDGQ